jgi:hypothetical protein
MTDGMLLREALLDDMLSQVGASWGKAQPGGGGVKQGAVGDSASLAVDKDEQLKLE